MGTGIRLSMEARLGMVALAVGMIAGSICLCYYVDGNAAGVMAMKGIAAFIGIIGACGLISASIIFKSKVKQNEVLSVNAQEKTLHIWDCVKNLLFGADQPVPLAKHDKL